MKPGHDGRRLFVHIGKPAAPQRPGHADRGVMDLEKYLVRRGGAARRGDLLRAGFRRPALEAAVDSGRLYRPLRGVYALHTADDGVLAAFRANGRLTCVSAARFYSLWALHPPREVHLSCGNGVPKVGVIDHAPCMHASEPGYPVAGLADVLLHALRCLPELEALALVQSATGRGQISADFLRDKLIGNRNGRARAVLGLLISAGRFRAGDTGPYPLCPGRTQRPHACSPARGGRG